MKKPSDSWRSPGQWPVSQALLPTQPAMKILTHQARPVHSGGKHISNSTQANHPRHRAVRQACADAPHGGAGGALGTITKLGAAADAMSRRVERYALQAVARGILPKSRTALCLRTRVKGADGVGVWKCDHSGTAHYSGLIVCGSVWTCPVCGAKISEKRRGELQAAIEQHKARGGDVLLLTLTTPHERGDDLAALVELQGLALRAFFRQRAVKAILAEMDELGRVRAFELTHGRKSTNNGWHPHFHFLQFVRAGVDAARLMDWKTRLYLEWAKACQRVGLGVPSFKHGIDLRDGSYAQKYVSKWGLDSEMTKGHIKKAKSGGETPFDLLRALLADPKDRQAAALFSEFAQVFKGKRQFSWSNGLKAMFDLEEKTDDELAEEHSEEAQLLGMISVEQWRDVLRVEGRALVLELAAARGWPAVARFLDFVKGASSGLDFDAATLAEAREILLQW